MNDALIAISNRLAACPRFRWMEGMKPWFSTNAGLYRLLLSKRSSEDDEPGETVKIMGLPYTEEAPAWGWPAKGSGWIPDLNDPATRGCVLEMARAAWSRPDLVIRASRDAATWWPDCIGTPDALLEIRGGTEAEALVATLEAASIEAV